jgi:hypothetical protein
VHLDETNGGVVAALFFDLEVAELFCDGEYRLKASGRGPTGACEVVEVEVQEQAMDYVLVSNSTL